MPETVAFDRWPEPGRPLWPEPPADHRLGELATRLSRTLALARALIQGGRTLDISGVEDGVGLLCAQTLDLPIDHARALLPALHDLLRQLDQLSTAVHAALPMGRRPC